MNNDLSKLMKQAYNQPETGLSADIWRVIEAKQAKGLKIKSLSYGFIGILSLGGFVLMSVSIVKQLSASGFFQYFSLAFSDGSLISIYWKEYLLSLSDSLPVASLGVTFFLLLSMLVSIKKSIEQYKNKLLIS
jgi:hypothetical protein